MKATVLGSGLVGSLISKDLAETQGFEVVAVDADPDRSKLFASSRNISFQTAELSSPGAIRDLVADADVVVGAVPGRLGLMMLRTVIEAGKPISDISFAPENALELTDLAEKHRTTAVIDAGVSPGLSNLAVGRASAILDSIEDATIYVGGLPLVRKWPWEYRSVFSPTDVIEEYLRPARLVENGAVVIRTALSEVEPVEFPTVGTLEAFNTDGLRSLLHTVKARNMKEKTLRYPGHADRMRALRDAGFFSDVALDIDGQSVVPRKVTEHLLFAEWERPFGETEITVLRVVVEGPREGSMTRVEFTLSDTTDHQTGATSMARTTGFPCAIIAGMLARGEIRDCGVLAPEHLGRDGTIYDSIVSQLADRNVALSMTTTEMEDR